MTVHHLDTYRPGYYAELAQFTEALQQQITWHERVSDLNADVVALFPELPVRYMPGMLALMGRSNDARELAGLIAMLSATEDEDFTEVGIRREVAAMLPLGLAQYCAGGAA